MDDNAYTFGYETGVDAGRREVVAWIEANTYMDDYGNSLLCTNESYANLKAKLKEWGIEQ